MNKFISVCLVASLISIECLAGFGGSRSSGSFSSGRSSYSGSSSFGGSRSSFSSSGSSRSFSSPSSKSSSSGSVFGGSRSSSATGGATIIRPSTPSSSGTSYSSPSVVHTNTTVIHSGPSMWDYMWWSSMFHHQQPTVIVAAGQPGMVQPGVPVIVEQQVGHSFFYYLIWFVVFLSMIGTCIFIFNRWEDR